MSSCRYITKTVQLKFEAIQIFITHAFCIHWLWCQRRYLYIYIYIPQMELSTHFTCRSPSQHKTYRDLINNFSSSNYQYLSVLPRDSRSLFSHSTTIKTGLLRSTCDQIWMRAQSLNTGELALMERWGNGRGREESVSLGSAVTKLQALRAFSNADLPSSTLSPLH